MIEFSRDQIEGTKEYFVKEGFPVEESQLGEVEVSYFVIPQALNPVLEDFALRMTFTDPETNEVSGIFGVSDSVPAELRPYWAAHEIIEFTDIGIDKVGRCEESEVRVLDLVPVSLKKTFIDRRIAFFKNLISYFEGEIRSETGNFTEADMQEAQATLSFLMGLQGE